MTTLDVQPTLRASAPTPIPAPPSHPWTQFYDEGVSATLQHPSFALWELVRDAAQNYPGNIAIDFMGYTMTYAKLWDSVQRFANALQSLGIKKGDCLAIMLPNCPQFVIAFYGAHLAGALVTTINPLYTARELEHVMKDSGAETLVVLDLKYPVFREIAGTTHIKRTIVTGIQDFLPFPKNLLFPFKARQDGTWVDVKPAPSIFLFKRLLQKYAPTPSKVDINPKEDVAMLLYTGGTTGFPKAAMLTHWNLGVNAIQCNDWAPGLISGKEVAGAVLPFFHVYGLSTVMNFGMRIAAKLVLFPKFSAHDVVVAIQQHHITLLPGVPTMYVAINNFADIAKYDLSSIKTCMSGGAPLPIEVKHEFEAMSGGKLIEGYGLSESSAVLTSNTLQGDTREGSIGLPIADTELMIMDENGSPVPHGEVGEIWASGPQIMKGYWNRPEETAKSLRQLNGKTWLVTGDMARMDDDGYFYIVDRKKDLILVGGFNVFPREVEEVLYEHPQIKEAIVAGVPDKFHGEYVKAYVVLHEAQQVTEEEVIAFCKERMAPYKTPKKVEFRAELPKTIIGKILRRALLDEEKQREAAAAADTMAK
jgi:long-chain acyl-CoA synthetase